MAPDQPDRPEGDPLDDAEHLETDLDSDDPLADPDDPANDPAMAPVVEAGGGVSEGFEESEKQLDRNAEGEEDDDPLRNPFRGEPEEEGKGAQAGDYGDSDEVLPGT